MLSAVAHRAAIDPREAEEAVAMVFQALRQSLPSHALQRLGAALPAEAAGRLLAGGLSRGPAFMEPLAAKEQFVGPLVNQLETEAHYDETLGGLDLVSVHTGDEAARRVQAVFSVLKESTDPATHEALATELPGEVAGWWRDAGP